MMKRENSLKKKKRFDPFKKDHYKNGMAVHMLEVAGRLVINPSNMQN